MDGFYLLSFGLIIAGVRLGMPRSTHVNALHCPSPVAPLKRSDGGAGAAFSRKAEEMETAKEDTWIV